jgi:hypothetical protein
LVIRVAQFETIVKRRGFPTMSTATATAHKATAATLGTEAANVAGIINAPIMAPVVLSTGNGMVLTVGAGMEFATLGAALRDAVNGDTIAVKAGTYVNDFSVVQANVTIVAVGGMVNEVGTEPPPDGKGIITADASLTISGFSFTGAGTGDQYGNVAGIRYEAGNLNVSYCDFHNLQDGLLATPWVSNTGTVNIDHSSFEQDGSGDGYTHDIYIGDVADFNLTNSVITSAYVGHEVKSRADITNISHNVIADGPTGTGSYDIDIPNAGAATVSDNIIEKGPDASNQIAIHYGGETQYSYATNYLNVTGNTIIDDLAGQTGIAVANQSSYNDVNVSVNMTDNQLYGFDPGNVIIEGAGTQTGDTVLSSEPGFSTASPTSELPSTSITGPERLTLNVQNQTVTGGASLFVVNDSVGGNTIGGGAGGMQAYVAGQSDMITTQAGASDTVTAAGEYDTVNSAGTDHITASGQYQTIEATGAATVTGSHFNTYDLNGNEALVTTSDSLVDVGSTATARIFDNGGDVSVTVSGGGRAGIVNGGANGSVASSATVSGGAATAWISGGGAISITTGDGGASVQAGLGTVNVTGGDGPDTLSAGGGSAFFTLGSGNDVVNLGKGTTQVTGGSGVDTYVFHASTGGNDTINGFKPGTDVLEFKGFANNANAIASGVVVNGSTILTLTDGSTVDIAGVALPGYKSSTGTSTSNPGTSAPVSSSPTQPTVSGGGSNPTGPQESNGTLTAGGQTITGGSSLLTIGDAVGNNTIAGGSGGVNVSAAPGDLITTQAGATDTINLMSYDTVTGAGNDQVTASYSHDVINESGNASISLLGANEQVTGGAGVLQITDDVTGNTIAGGSGGIIANLSGSYDVISTSVGATDTLTLTTQDTVTAGGNDQISISGNYNQIEASGTDVINSTSASSQYDLEGHDSLTTSGGGNVTVGGSAVDSVFSTGTGGLNLTTESGGSVAVTQTLGTGNAAATVAGGATSIMTQGGNYAGIYVTAAGGDSVTAGTGPVSVTSSASAGGPADTINAGSGSMSVTSGNAQIFGGSGALVVNAQSETAGTAGVQLGAGSGNVTLNGGAGNELFTGGSGQAQIWLGGGQDTVSFGSGLTTVHGGVADVFLAPTNGGSAVILNWNAQDTLAGAGSIHATPAITSQSVVNGSTYLSFVGGGQIELAGVSHFG